MAGLDFEDREERRRQRQATSANPFAGAAGDTPLYDAGPGATPMPQIPSGGIDLGGGRTTENDGWGRDWSNPQQPRINDPYILPNVPIGNTGHTTPAPPSAYNPALNHDQLRRDLASNPGLAQTYTSAAGPYVGVMAGSSGGLSQDDLQQRLAQFRSEASQKGVRVDESDAIALRQMEGWTPGSLAFNNTAPQFNDPSARLLEDYALDRFRQRTNPDPNSGTAQYEAYLRQLADTLGQPVYSDQDEAIIKTSTIDGLTKERDATRQRWLEVVSQRGMDPSSGIALDGLRQIDEHYGTLRTQVEADFARDAIGATRQQRFQRADVFGRLAGNEEGRLSDAANYARIPLSLQDRAFGMGSSLVNAGGSPANLFTNALSFLNSQQGFQRLNAQDRAAFTQGLMEYFGYLFT